MFKIRFVLFMSLVFIVETSCFHPRSNITSIDVSFLEGNVEKPLTLSCGALAIMKESLKDTILLNVKDLFEIERQLTNLKIVVIDSTVNDCDVRLHCLINFKNKKTIRLCIGQFNCILQDNIRMTNNDTLVYLIRKLAGYYCYFSREQLDYFNELTYFGVPNNYKDLSGTIK